MFYCVDQSAFIAVVFLVYICSNWFVVKVGKTEIAYKHLYESKSQWIEQANFCEDRHIKPLSQVCFQMHCSIALQYNNDVGNIWKLDLKNSFPVLKVANIKIMRYLWKRCIWGGRGGNRDSKYGCWFTETLNVNIYTWGHLEDIIILKKTGTGAKFSQEEIC